MKKTLFQYLKERTQKKPATKEEIEQLKLEVEKAKLQAELSKQKAKTPSKLKMILENFSDKKEIKL